MTTRLSRRAFLGSTTAAGAWAVSGARVEGAVTPAPGRTLKIGVASYSLRKFPLDKALAAVKGMGVRHMTFKDVHVPRTTTLDVVREARKQIDTAGITVMGGGTINMPNDQVQIRKDFEYAKAAGFPLVYVSPDPAALDYIEAQAREFDIKVAIHNHGPEDKWYPAPQDAYAKIKTRDKRMGLCVDIGHTLRAGVDPVEAVRTLRDRVYDMHVKDLRNKTDRDSQVEVGRGIIDFPALFRALLEIGYEGQVGLEYEINADDPVAGMTESIAYMRGVLAALTT